MVCALLAHYFTPTSTMSKALTVVFLTIVKERSLN
jgi:hypothetical protein